MQRLEYFRLHAREFSNLSDDIVNAWISSALVFYPSFSNTTGEKLELGVALYAAHLAWISKYPGEGGASRGPVVSEKDDKLERRHAMIQGADTYMGQSPYGQQFETLMKGGVNKHRPSIMTRFS